MNVQRSYAQLVTALGCAFAMAAAPAGAQDGVFVDPDSPSGKEYRLPVDSVRRGTASKDERIPARAEPAPAPLFGEGVGEDDDNSGGKTRGRPAAGRPRGAASPAHTQPARSPERVPAAAADSPVPADGSSGLLYAAIGLLLCAAGAGTGWWLRNRRA